MGASLPAFMVFSAMSLMLLIGVLLRAKVGLIQKAMIPSSLLGGALGFVLVSLGWLKYPGLDGTWVTSRPVISFLGLFMLSISASISLCLTRTAKGAPKHRVFKGGLWLSMVWSVSLTRPGPGRRRHVVAYNALTGSDINVFLGYLITHGFTQGPGQGWPSAGSGAKFTRYLMGRPWA